MYYYVEIKDKKIISCGNASNKETALKGNKTGELMELTMMEYHLLSACGGDIQTGKKMLKNLFKKIQMFESDWE
jgi:hypothetical protein